MRYASIALGFALTSTPVMAAIHESFDNASEWPPSSIYSPSGGSMPHPWYRTSGDVVVSGGSLVLFGSGAGFGYQFASPLVKANAGALTISIDVFPGFEQVNGANAGQLAGIRLTGNDTGVEAGPAYMPVIFRIADSDDPQSEAYAEDHERQITDYQGSVKGTHSWGVGMKVNFAIDADWTQMTRTVTWGGDTLATWTEAIDPGFAVTGLYMSGYSYSAENVAAAPSFDSFYASVPEPGSLGVVLLVGGTLLKRRRTC